MYESTMVRGFGGRRRQKGDRTEENRTDEKVAEGEGRPLSTFKARQAGRSDRSILAALMPVVSRCLWRPALVHNNAFIVELLE